MMINATDIRKGVIIKMDGELFQVLTYHHATPGNLRGFVQTKLRNLKTGTQKDYRFRSTDRVEKAFLDTHQMSYLYADSDHFYFMNTETFEQVSLGPEALGDAVNYLKPETVITVDFYDGKPVGVELPAAVELLVVETDPAVKNATVSNVTKHAKLETGLVVQVPPFVEEGDIIKVNTDSGTYISRC
ncbi:MAG: elongation factor P [Acidobacteria bacterium]|nr:elongation factor P [Acidobacteriota bacterium]